MCYNRHPRWCFGAALYTACTFQACFTLQKSWSSFFFHVCNFHICPEVRQKLAKQNLPGCRSLLTDMFCAQHSLTRSFADILSRVRSYFETLFEMHLCGTALR